MFPFLSLAFPALAAAATISTPSAVPSTVPSLVSQYGLSTTTSYAQPTQTLNATKSFDFMKKNWSLNRDRMQAGEADIKFITDPFGSTSGESKVLAVQYSNGSYGGSGDGGAQFYSQPINSSSSSEFTSMLLSYEVGFDDDFAFNMGGKLPGLRGGSDLYGCSGGSEATPDCFSARLMWRSFGQGEIYAYIPTNGSGICAESDVICNSDYGTSLSRGSWTFQTGAWNAISLFVQLNNPVNVANGKMMVFVNDTLILSHTDLQIRSATSLSSIGGLFFSTFFGGATSDWASPANQSSYYRNFQILAGTAASDGSGKTIGSSSGAGHKWSAGGLSIGLLGGLVLGFML